MKNVLVLIFYFSTHLLSAFEWEHVVSIPDPNWDVSDEIIFVNSDLIWINRNGVVDPYSLSNNRFETQIPLKRIVESHYRDNPKASTPIPGSPSRTVFTISEGLLKYPASFTLSFATRGNPRISQFFQFSIPDLQLNLSEGDGSFRSDFIRYMNNRIRKSIEVGIQFDSSARLTTNIPESNSLFPLELSIDEIEISESRESYLPKAMGSRVLVGHTNSFTIKNRDGNYSRSKSPYRYSRWTQRVFFFDDSPVEGMFQEFGLGKYAKSQSIVDDFLTATLDDMFRGIVLDYSPLSLSSDFVSYRVFEGRRIAGVQIPPFFIPNKKNELSVFRQISNSPFDFSPRGNLFAFPEKDPATGLFKHWAVYRIILDGTINNTSVRVRSAPNTTGAVLTQLNRGARVKVLDRTDEEETIGGQTNYWYQVRLADRREGWVFGAFLDVSRE